MCPPKRPTTPTIPPPCQVIILARECGLRLELADIPVESLVAVPLREVGSAAEYLQRLPEFDADFAALREDAEGAREVGWLGWGGWGYWGGWGV